MTAISALGALLCVAATFAFSQDVGEVVPEAAPHAGETVMVGLHRRLRSPETHAVLTDFIAHTHSRETHPIVLVDEDSRLVSEVKLQNADLVEYFGQVTVGGQLFTVVYDTGSGILWVPGGDCHDEACQTHNRLAIDDHVTAEDGDVVIQYGTGSIVGQRAVANVQVGNVEVAQQDFLMSTQENGPVFAQGQFDGVFGMGRKALARLLVKRGDVDSRADPFYISAIKQGKLHKPEFSFYVSNTENEPGAMVLGGVNPNLMLGSVAWHTGCSDSFWMMEIESLTAGSVTVDTSDAAGGGFSSLRGIADTGTSLLVMPEQFIGDLLPSLNVEDDCSNIDELVDFTIAMRAKDGTLQQYLLTPDDYVIARGGYCKTGIAIMDIALPGHHPTAILGDVFLRSYYSVYNHERNEVGFARANHAHNEDIPTLIEDDLPEMQAEQVRLSKVGLAKVDEITNED